LPADNPNKINFLDIYASTEHNNAKGPDRFMIYDGVEADGEWHVLVVDLTGKGFGSASSEYIKVNEKTGKYHLGFARIDLFNGNVDPKTHWDIAFIAMHDDLTTVVEANTDVAYITVATGPESIYKIDPQTGEKIQ
jgi:hypothetical protein